MRKLWCIIATGQSENLREQTDDQKGKQTEDNSRERGVEKQLKAAAQRGYPWRPKIPWWHLQIMTSANLGDSWSLQNRDLWLRPTDMSWHLPILITIREEPFKNCRSRTSEKWKVKEDKIEEAKKQKVKRSDEEWNVPTGNHHLGHDNDEVRF